jgi:hypothetical protein
MTTMNHWTPIAAISVVALALAIGCEVREVSGPAPAAPGAAAGCSNQPNMNTALTELRSARGSLAKAEHNKGGWRDAAIASTDTAIRETERGCAFADTH